MASKIWQDWFKFSLFSVFVALLLVKSSSGLKCYVCDDESCHDPFDEDIPLEKCGKNPRNQTHNSCMKLITEQYEVRDFKKQIVGKTTTRMCAFAEDDSRDTCWSHRGNAGNTYTCHCSSDECNHGNHATSSTAAIFVGLASVFMLKMRQL